MELHRPSLSSLLRSRVASAMRRGAVASGEPAVEDPVTSDEISPAEEAKDVAASETTPSRPAPAELTGALREFSLALDAAKDGDEMRSLWRTTSLPYSMEAADPRSAGYKQEVLDRYKALTGSDYSSGVEMTSTKQDFEIGDPWASRDLSVAASELAKPIQVLQAFAAAGNIGRVIEFGSGRGNLALPLARAGLQVTAIDIDKAYLDGLSERARREKVQIETVHCDFIECGSRLEKAYDAAVFQSSFHHCLEFDALLQRISASVLKPGGCIYFFNEPVFKDYDFPWGLRYDGEGLWAIIKKHWLELGFSEDFFITLLNGHGYTVTAAEGIPGLLGPGWRASPPGVEIPFNQVALPSRHEAGFFQSDSVQTFRFCKAVASLPGEFGLGEAAQCELHFTNILPIAMSAEVTAGGVTETVQLEPNSSQSILTTPKGDDIVINSQTFVADSLVGNGDTRELGIGLERVSWS